MTICNMSIEGGARAGYVNPDETTFAFLKGRRFVPSGAAFDRAVAWWRQIASDPDARLRRPRDDRCRDHRADGHLGHQPRSVGGHWRAYRRFGRPGGADVHGVRARRRRCRARASTSPSSDRAPTAGCPISRRPRASSAGATSRRTCEALVVPGSQAVSRAAEAKGLPEIFTKAGFEWRGAGCSMCLGDEPRPARRAPDLRVLVEPEFQGPSGQSRRAGRCS